MLSVPRILRLGTAAITALLLAGVLITSNGSARAEPPKSATEPTKQTYLLSCPSGDAAIELKIVDRADIKQELAVDIAGVRLWADSVESLQRIRARVANAAAARRLVTDAVDKTLRETGILPDATPVHGEEGKKLGTENMVRIAGGEFTRTGEFWDRNVSGEPRRPTPVGSGSAKSLRRGDRRRRGLRHRAHRLPTVKNNAMNATVHHQIVIVGGGTAGISVAARLTKGWFNKLDVAVIEPSDKHYYQPLWTLVGGGVFDKKMTERSEASVMPTRAKWFRDAVSEFHPEENYLLTRDGTKITYDWLVVTAGIQVNWDQIPGLKESIGKNGVCSNYSFEYVDSTWENIRDFKGGTALFTQPSGAVKCGGAPQKIMYLAEDAFCRSGVRDKTNVVFAAASPHIFAVEKYRVALEKVVARKKIDCRFRHELVEIRPQSKEAVFKHLDSGELISMHYDMLHVTPPMSAPKFIAQSPLADKEGWVEVDKYTLRHARFPNVFSLGDCSNLPTSKTGAAIRKQAPVVAKNLLAAMRGNPLTAKYDGYTSCPVVTGYGSLILAEFDYDKNPAETFPFDQSKERWSMWLLKKYLLPILYWKGMLKGRA